MKKAVLTLLFLTTLNYLYCANFKDMTNIQQEIWEYAYGYEGLYQVSNHGRMRSIDRTIINKLGHKCAFKGKVIFQSPDNKGYMKVCLWRNNKTTSKRVHRFVALAFIPNPNNLPQVNHKDGNKSNAHVDNLEWVNNQYNQIHSFKELGRRQKRGSQHAQSKPVYQLSHDGFFLAEYGSINEAELESGIPARTIINTALGIFRTSRTRFNWAF